MQVSVCVCVQLHLKLILIPLDRPAIVTLVHTVKSPMKHDGQTMLCHPTDVSKPHRIYSEPCNPKESNFRALLELLKWPITLNPIGETPGLLNYQEPPSESQTQTTHAEGVLRRGDS